MSKPGSDKPPDAFCPEKGCGKKMSAFKRGRGWKYICPDAPKHAKDKLEARQKGGGSTGRGGVKKGTPSPLRGKQREEKPYRTRYDWRRKPKDKDEDGK